LIILIRMILPLVAMLLAFAPLSAKASIRFVDNNPQLTSALVDRSVNAHFPIAAPGSITKLIELTELSMPALPTIAVAELPQPSIETPLHKLFCVEYARARSGLAVFGDAKYWWARAKSLYSRAAAPMENTVMVFSGSKRLKRGHVAVVTHIVSKREIRVDQANWQNHGEIDLATPVLDVSTKNDWSKVRVWDMRSNGFGAHVYAVSGFIAKELVKRASND
jgi:hypothetical protein